MDAKDQAITVMEVAVVESMAFSGFSSILIADEHCGLLSIIWTGVASVDSAGISQAAKGPAKRRGIPRKVQLAIIANSIVFSRTTY